MPEGLDALLVVLNSIFAVLVLFTNSIVIIVIFRSHELQLPTLWNIAFMAAWDLAFGLQFLLFIVPSKVAGDFVYPDIVGNIEGKLLAFIITQNIINIIIALVDRYIAICWPLHYLQIMSPKRFAYAVTSGLLVNIVRLIILSIVNVDVAYNKDLGYFTSQSKKTGASVSGIFALATVCIIIGFLIRIRLELRKSLPNKGRQEVTATQFTYTMYLSTLVYVLSYMPLAITLLVEMITHKKSIVMLQMGMTFILSNSLWNVFIYATNYRPFRSAFLKVFCPTFFRERARSEVQAQFQRNRINVFTVGEANC